MNTGFTAILRGSNIISKITPAPGGGVLSVLAGSGVIQRSSVLRFPRNDK
jgi:hypothetical protein